LTEWIAVWRGAGSNLFAAYFMSGLANGLLLSRRPAEALAKADEALALADQLGEQFFAAELHRLRGEAVLALHPEQPEGAASAFEQAVAIARAQQARAFELKAITALHRLRARQSRADETEPRLRQALDPFLPASDEPITMAGLSALGVQQ
jgi:predicted ATPase